MERLELWQNGGCKVMVVRSFSVPIWRGAWQGGVAKNVRDRPAWGRGRTTWDGRTLLGRHGSAMPFRCADDTYEDMESIMWS